MSKDLKEAKEHETSNIYYKSLRQNCLACSGNSMETTVAGLKHFQYFCSCYACSLALSLKLRDEIISPGHTAPKQQNWH